MALIVKWTFCFHSLILLTLCLLLLVKSQKDVRLPPAITEGPPRSPVFYRMAKDVVLPCLYDSTPPPYATEWTKDNQRLDINSGIEVVGVGATIRIKSIMKANEGFYQCFVKNLYGTAMSNSSWVRVAVLDDFADSTTKQLYGTQGQSFSMPCDAPLSEPPPVFKWASVIDDKDDSPVEVTTSKRLQIDSQGSLHFSYLTNADTLGSRLYKCEVLNTAMDVLKGGSYTKLNVGNGNVQNFAPKIEFRSGNVVVALVNGTAKLRCFFAANPEADISWKKVGGSLPNGRYRLNEFGSELELTYIRQSDEGKYECTGRNTAGSAVETIQLNVESAPVFMSVNDSFGNLNLTEKDSVTLRCNADAIPPVTSVTWYRNAELLNTNKLPPKFSLSSDGLQLTIRNLCKKCDPDDLSVIQCNASNIHGYAFSQGYINVLEPTVITSESTTVYFVANEEVIFPCNASSDPSTPVTYSWRYNGAKLVMDDSVYFDPNKNELHIKTGNDSDGGYSRTGVYQCVATNGVSESTLDNYYMAQPQAAKSFSEFWWIALIIALILFIILLFILCYIYMQRNKGDVYSVDEKERVTGNNPEQDLIDEGFHDYQRPASTDPLVPNAEPGSMSGSLGNTYFEDDSSLNAYALSDAGKFQEDGSFIGKYNTNRSRSGQN